MAQYLRKCSIVIAGADGNGLNFADLKCVFHIQRGDVQTPNSCYLRIYNLSQATIATIQGEYTQISISAGYEGGTNYGLIFQGTIIQTRYGRHDGRDTYLDITAADGDEAYQYAFIAKPVPGGSKPGQVANILYDAFKNKGLTEGYMPELDGPGLPRGKVLYGRAKKLMRQFAADQECLWHVQDGRLNMCKLNGYIPGQAVVVSPQTGLIDTPEQTQLGIRMRMLLNANIKIGRLILLKDTAVNLYRFQPGTGGVAERVAAPYQNRLNPEGYYYVMQANHSGDTRGREWYTEVVCLSVDATVIDKNVTVNSLSAQDPSFAEEDVEQQKKLVQKQLGGY